MGVSVLSVARVSGALPKACETITFESIFVKFVAFESANFESLCVVSTQTLALSLKLPI